MTYGIVADSACDVNPELQKWLQVRHVPMTLMLGNTPYVDDESLDLPQFMQDMSACPDHVGTAAPAPGLWKETFEAVSKPAEVDTVFGITLTSKLSATYESAVLGGELFTKEHPEKSLHIFDSLSAGPGMTLVAIKLKRLIEQGLPKPHIIETIENFISTMSTYFVLGDIENLLKNGRLNRITGRLINTLHIKPLMRADKGVIGLHGQTRGDKQIIEKLAATVRKVGKKTAGEICVIDHCNNLPLAQRLRDRMEQLYDFAEVFITQTAGLCSLYAEDKGIIISF